MKKSTLTIALLGAIATAPALAADWTVTGNVNVLTDYRFRGISQTLREPAIQGGFDAAHKSGFYIGNWNSNVSGVQYPGGPGIEMDFYGGYKGEIGKTGLTFDVGNLYYYYGNARFAGNTKVDNNEIYGALTYGPLTGKISYATTDYFGLNNTTGGQGDSRGTTYSELNYTSEIAPKVTLIGHVGYTDIKNYSALSYTDYKVGVSYDLNGFALGAAVVGNDVKEAAKPFYSATNALGETKKLFGTGIVLSLGKTF